MKSHSMVLRDHIDW